MKFFLIHLIDNSRQKSEYIPVQCPLAFHVSYWLLEYWSNLLIRSLSRFENVDQCKSVVTFWNGLRLLWVHSLTKQIVWLIHNKKCCWISSKFIQLNEQNIENCFWRAHSLIMGNSYAIAVNLILLIPIIRVQNRGCTQIVVQTHAQNSKYQRTGKT